MGSIASSLAACWPGLSAQTEDVAVFSPPVAGWRLQTRLFDALPLMPANEKQFDLPTSLLSLLSRTDSLTAAFQLVVEPFEDPRWREGAFLSAEKLTHPDPSFTEVLTSTLLGTSSPSMPSLKWLNALQQEAHAKAASSFLFRASTRFVVSGQRAAEVRGVAMEAASPPDP